ncbi:MAG: lasso peptide biosynthesis B2 protein [Gemmatimonadota bacterium]|nr:lasso peptide biosynthesis B2 protein [Gemmatimonadota bacterium]
MTAARRFMALPRDRKRLYIEAWGWTWIARLRLWLTRKSKVRKVLGPVIAVPETPHELDEERSDVQPVQAVRGVARAIEAVAAFVPKVTCLVKALALRGMLARRGQPSGVRLGVARNGLGLDAHAWVEVPGVGEFGRAGQHLDFIPLGGSPGEDTPQARAEAR